MTVAAPERKRTRCVECHRRRVCWVIRRIGLVMYVCDWCLFLLAHGERAADDEVTT